MGALGDKLCDHPADYAHPLCIQAPSPIVTRRSRRLSVTERAMQGPVHKGKIKYFCRQRGHGFVTPAHGGDDLFVHITDIDGEYVPHEGDEVAFKECACPPKFEKMQAIHVTIKNLAPGHHERWSEPPLVHAHPHPTPNTQEMRHPELPVLPPAPHTDG